MPVEILANSIKGGLTKFYEEQDLRRAETGIKLIISTGIPIGIHCSFFELPDPLVNEVFKNDEPWRLY